VLYQKQIVKVKLSADELEVCKDFALKLDAHFTYKMAKGKGGKSNIHDTEERIRTRRHDNIVGQICEAAGHIALWRPFERYVIRRERMLANPDAGDDEDIDGIPVDIKGSLARYSKPYLDYNLPVRPRERKPGLHYVAALLDSTNVVHVIGWATDEMLPEHPETFGPLKGAYVIRNRDLFPMCMFPMKFIYAGIRKRKDESCGRKPTS